MAGVVNGRVEGPSDLGLFVARIVIKELKGCNWCGRPTPYVVYYITQPWGWRVCAFHLSHNARQAIENMYGGDMTGIYPSVREWAMKKKGMTRQQADEYWEKNKTKILDRANLHGKLQHPVKTPFNARERRDILRHSEDFTEQQLEESGVFADFLPSEKQAFLRLHRKARGVQPSTSTAPGHEGFR